MPKLSKHQRTNGKSINKATRISRMRTRIARRLGKEA